MARQHFRGEHLPPPTLHPQLPAAEGDDRHGRGEREGAPDNDRSEARARAALGLDAPAQGFRRPQRRDLRLDRRAQRQPLVAESGALGALDEVHLELARVGRRELTVEIQIDLRFKIGMSHVNAFCSRLRARASRDITVPTGTSVTSLISLYDNPSSSRSTITSRNSSGS